MAYEDFTTFTESDEGNDVTIDSATKVSWVNLYVNQQTAYLYKDKGVDHFSGDFTHKFELYFSELGYFHTLTHWMLANIVGDLKELVDASEDGCCIYALNDFWDNEDLKLAVVENGGQTVDTWAAPGPQLSTLYFIEIVRDDNGGANNTGRYTAYIRTGSHTGVLQDTLVVDSSAGEQNDFRYLYALATYDNADNWEVSDGYTQNLDIDAGAVNYDETLRSLTITSTVSETDVQTYLAENRLVTIVLTTIVTDFQAYADKKLLVVILVTVSADDFGGFDELGQSVNLSLSISETAIQTYKDLLTLIPIALTPSISDIQVYIDTSLAIPMTMGISVFDSVPYNDTDLLISIISAVSITDIQGYSEILTISLSMEVTKTDIQTYIDNMLVLMEMSVELFDSIFVQITIPMIMSLTVIDGYGALSTRQAYELISREKSFELIGRNKTYYLEKG
jgi:hypothetical protein